MKRAADTPPPLVTAAKRAKIEMPTLAKLALAAYVRTLPTEAGQRLAKRNPQPWSPTAQAEIGAAVDGRCSTVLSSKMGIMPEARLDQYIPGARLLTIHGSIIGWELRVIVPLDRLEAAIRADMSHDWFEVQSRRTAIDIWRPFSDPLTWKVAYEATTRRVLLSATRDGRLFLTLSFTLTQVEAFCGRYVSE